MRLLLNNSDTKRFYSPVQTVRHLIHTAKKAYLRQSVKFLNEKVLLLRIIFPVSHKPEIALRKIVDMRAQHDRKSYSPESLTQRPMLFLLNPNALLHLHFPRRHSSVFSSQLHTPLTIAKKENVFLVDNS